MSDVALNRQFDVVVLGAGAAGSVAAATIAAHGRTVALVSQFAGATAQSSGAVDGGDADSLRALKGLCGDLVLKGTLDNTQLLVATEAGTIKPTSLVQETQCFNFNEVGPGSKIGVVGFSGLASFDAPAVAKMLAWSAWQFLGFEVEVKPVTVDLKGPWRSSLEMAKWLDSAGAEEQLVSSLRTQRGNLDAYLVPAVFGRKNYNQIWKNLQTIAPIYELLGMPTSVPGLRLQDALSKGTHDKGVTILKGEAISAKLEQGRVVALDCGEFMLECKAVILATGRYFSGGFERSGIRRERIFKLPLWSGGKLVEDLPSRQLTSPNMSDSHALLEASLLTDDSLRPYTQTMELFAPNLFVAGSALKTARSLGSSAQSGYESAFHTLNSIESQ